MTELDNKIKRIFYNVLENGEFINRDCKYFNFKLNDKDITIEVSGKYDDDKTENKLPTLEKSSTPDIMWWSFGIYSGQLGNSNGRTYYVKINGHNYIVLDVSRKEDAEIMDKLEQIIQNHEMETIDSLL